MTIIPTSNSPTSDSADGPGRPPAPRVRRSELISAQGKPGDARAEPSLRPATLSEYVGQSRLKAILEMSIAAAQSRGDALDHVLFYGPPGLGKTTLAQVIAHQMKARIHMATGPGLERPRDIIGLVHQLEAHDVLFIDEIHRLSKVAEELLYPAIEDFMIDLTAGKGQSTRSMRLPLPRFTLIGATTKAGMISNALRDRFGFTYRLEFYDVQELSQIVERTAAILQLPIEPAAKAVIAQRSRGTPRIANRLVRLVRDYAQYKGNSLVTGPVALDALAHYQIDESGLDPTDRKLLEIIIDNYSGGPVGVDSLAATLGEDPNTLEDVYEPYLIQQGFIQRTPRGRLATDKAYAYLGRPELSRQLRMEPASPQQFEEGETGRACEVDRYDR